MRSEGDGEKCGPRPTRREFIEFVSLASLAPVLPMPVMAGPFDDVNDYLRLIPADKKLDPKWLASLHERGAKPTYDEPGPLEHIGMPVGGLFAGTVYVNGQGELWLWDVFNHDQEGIQPRQVEYAGAKFGPRDGANFVEPARRADTLVAGFGIDVPTPVGLVPKTTFDGRYPIARISKRDPGLPVEIDIETFSPFVPLDLEASSLPATIYRLTVRNTSREAVPCRAHGWLNNVVCRTLGPVPPGEAINRVLRRPGLTILVASAKETPNPRARPDILFADFEGETYSLWKTEGTAFGAGPVEMAKMPSYQGEVGGHGGRVVNSHASAPGNTIAEKDARTGRLISPEFVIERDYVHFLIGGGNHPGKTCLNLLIDGEVVLSATGRAANRMAPGTFSVARWVERKARLEVVDEATGSWGNIGVDQIVFSDSPSTAPISERLDFGTMAIGLLGEDEADMGPSNSMARPLTERLQGDLSKSTTLAPGESKTFTFVVAWHFPNFRARGLGDTPVGHHYATRFDDAAAVVRYVHENQERLIGDTREWVETWYDSTLPYWFLDRTMANTSTLATTTCYRLRDGRFWAWEGVGCCEGTCTHVWHYAQAPGWLFPELERDTRRRVDFGLAQHEDGGIGMRANLNGANEPAHDGQCGRILGAYREHLCSPDDRFLRTLWPNIKKAIEYLIKQDGDGDGMIEGAQPNTLDAAWYGRVPFLASLYLATLKAGETMAREMGDDPFADRCRAIAGRGSRTILDLFNGEFFIQKEDPEHANAIGVGAGCYIDQVFGQTWAHWLGLGHLFDREKLLAALRALWKYNFVPDVGPFREKFKRGRWYALMGDAGLLMCTWPKGGQRPDQEKHWQFMYFNECMSGFEWQVAAHMIYEGIDQPDLLEAGLAIARAIHDRYDARKRNPYNEVECSDHYARAMASYGAFLAVCGFDYHGPKGHIGFAPRLTPDAFRAPFTAAEGWGAFEQEREHRGMTAKITVRRGRLKLLTVSLLPKAPHEITTARASLGHREIAARVGRFQGRSLVKLAEAVTIEVGQALSITLG